MSTNYKKGKTNVIVWLLSITSGLGEYEETIARAWHRTSNVRGLFLKQACPNIIKECESMLQTLVRPQTRGILATEEDNTFNLISFHATKVNDDDDSPPEGKPAPLPKGYGLAFQRAKPYHKIPLRAVLKARVHHLGLSYTSCEKHKGNSFVFLQNVPAPFMIENIVEFPPTGRNNETLRGTWIVGYHLKPSTSFSIDLYSKYRELGASIWSTESDPLLRAVMIAEIEAHGARLKWQDNWVVISLRRVCIFSELIIHTLTRFNLVSF